MIVLYMFFVVNMLSDKYRFNSLRKYRLLRIQYYFITKLFRVLTKKQDAESRIRRACVFAYRLTELL